MLRSLAPKSVTAPVAMGIAEQLGGIPALAAVFAVLTGLTGAVSGKYLFDRFGIAPMEVRGFALGTASHGVGAARALQVHPDALHDPRYATELHPFSGGTLLEIRHPALGWMEFVLPSLERIRITRSLTEQEEAWQRSRR